MVTSGSGLLDECHFMYTALEGLITTLVDYFCFVNCLVCALLLGEIDLLKDPMHDDSNFLVRGKDYDACVRTVQTKFGQVKDWLIDRKLRLNETKTVCMLFESRKKPGGRAGIQLGSTSLPYSEKTKFLGVVIDRTLSCRYHAQELAGKLASVCFALRKLKAITSKEALMSAYHGLFVSRAT
ncbi:hypothetical protein GE061_010425 [Apolygus lucorum]|uniref:Reverse transcriptase domain-containing protein n=1 Tax=Apolygus lucorum TaxID=248454 RepID=A0A8S9Y4J2_APOLU|nr:hypothetical protein GE061_010425 [Apolygus lucorum]